MTPNEALKKYFGYDQFRDGQLEIINRILDGSNVLCVLPTGGGKSICYQIPALLGSNFSIVVSPLIALMKDQVDGINKYHKVAAYINSSVDYREVAQIFNSLLSGEYKILFVSPEKIEQPEFVERIKNLSPDYIFIDEAHCISEWGHNFRPSYRNIIRFANELGNLKISAFTATASPEVQDDIINQLEFEKPIKVIKGFERDNISLRVNSKPGKKEITTALITTNGYPAIVYCATRKLCEEVALFLKYKNIKAEFYHAGLTTELRKIIQDDFINDRIDVIVATNAFGMGIDKSNIKNIIHYNLPGTIENYYQEIGRAGRDGNKATATLLYAKNDYRIQKFLIESAYPTETEIRLIYNAICNAAGLAIGSLPNSNIPITDELLLQLKSIKITPTKLESAVKTLEQSGYLKFSLNNKEHFSIQFRIDQKALHRYIKNESNKTISDLLILIIRDLGMDTFSKRIRFNPASFANKLDLPIEQIIKYLNQLNSYGFLEVTSPNKNGSIIIDSPRVDASKININFERLRLRMSNELNKLQRMSKYVNEVSCRFAYILNYFGENINEYRCGQCDNCTNHNSADIHYDEYLKEQIFDALLDLKSPIKTKDLIKLLQGTSSHPGLIKNKFYGTLQHFSKNEFEVSIEILVSENKVETHEKTIKVSENYKQLRFDNENQPPHDEDQYSDYLKIYNQLKEVRKEISRKFNQTEEVLCSNTLLADISKQLPETPSKLMSIKGITQRHFNKFGDEFLDVINAHRSKSELDLKLKERLPESSIQVADLLKKKYSLKDIVSLTKLPEAVVSMQIESIIELDNTIEINSLFEADEIKLIEYQIVNGLKDIKAIKKLLPTNISYGKVRIVLAKKNASISKF